MSRLSGPDAEARLEQAWQAVFGADPAAQRLVHVLAPPAGTERPAWLGGFAAYASWERDGREAGPGTWRAFAETAERWPYVANARRAAAAGIPNARICVLDRAEWAAVPAWQRYLVLVHAPGTAALAGETLYRVWREDCREAGLPDRDRDVNLWGAAGVMLTGYRDGDVDWREFLTSNSDTGGADEVRFAVERSWVTAMLDLAAARGERVQLPQLPPL